MSKVFFDTNILIYAADQHDSEKRDKARGVIREAAINGNGVISTQVMQEFVVVATKKLGIDLLNARALIRSFTHFETVSISPEHIYDAADISVLNRLSFWDGLIIAAAKAACCSTLYSEDMNNGQRVANVAILNPFC